MPELVVVAEQVLAPVPGGTARYTRELVRALAATAPAGWEVSTVVARHADPSAAIIPGANGPRVLSLPRRALTAAWERGLPLWPGGDSLHAPTPLAPARAKRGRSLVVTVHDTVPWTHPETLTRRGVSWHRRMITRAVERADAVVVPTAAVAADLSLHAPGSTRVEVIGEGVPASLREPSESIREAVVRRLAVPRRYLLAVGTVEPRKGLDVLIKALAEDVVPDVPLLVVGAQGWGKVDLAALARAAGLDAGRVRQLGAVTDVDLGVLLHGAAALVAPSQAEGFGLPVLEAMAAGVPVVHSDAPALVEVAGGAGISVPRNDATALARALRTVLTDAEHAAAMVDAGRLRARDHTWENAARLAWRVHERCYAAASAKIT
ncbi:glycosyltransferase family 4 protein [Allokutzneria albata]|uniref:Glycosyltransferase involved in cell wall bisynthesis n=1 Tax=Allokutzneria albata TaxID=211114 RepID=A0A1H0BE79_ALLAB|nr:glycosyltransferase family 1 protein [Allokutzneria albata]SDN43891.1 Glycosyltransferase involved in cell wall bisynthesis [Allokutzneria albata]